MTSPIALYVRQTLLDLEKLSFESLTFMFKQAVLELSEGIMKQDHITKGTLKDLEKRLVLIHYQAFQRNSCLSEYSQKKHLLKTGVKGPSRGVM